jgi:malonyl-CoA O-methyltransferase
MQTERPPTIDPVAAHRWEHRLPPKAGTASPWLHEEVARRMEARLEWIVQQPKSWVHWQPLQGGLQAHSLLTQRYPASQSYVVEQTEQRTAQVRQQLTPAWWRAERWRSNSTQFSAPTEPCQMVWANMALHMSADPLALITRWHQLLDADGFVMFTCLGPDTLQELRTLYADMSWPPPTHDFTDMHDWGDMLVQAGFAEPVMDMERIRLTYSSPAGLMDELRQLGRNLHPQRTKGLHGRAWREALYHSIATRMQQPAENGRLAVTFEIIYGHAFKPQPRIKVQPNTTFTLEQMQAALRDGKAKAKNQPDKL